MQAALNNDRIACRPYPGSFCFPYLTMFEADGRWKPVEKIRKQLTGIGVDLESSYYHYVWFRYYRRHFKFRT